MNKKISAVVIAYNEEENIQSCISSILKQTLRNFNLIVVDDGSVDKTSVIIKNFNDARIIYKRNKTRRGYSVSRNIGIANSDADYIFFTDADCIADKNWLKEGIKNFKRNVVAVGGVTRKLVIKDRMHPSQKCEIPTFATCNVAYKGDILRKIGGFRRRYNSGCEDTDLYERIKNYGGLVRSYRMVVYHKSKDLNIKRVALILERLKSLVYLIKDYYGAKKETFYEEKYTPMVNRVYMRIGPLYVVRPYFLLTIFMPPLLYFYFKKNNIQIKSIKSFFYIFLIYCYTIIMRLIIWKTVIKEKCLAV